MMEIEDLDYYEQRAEDEIEMARQAKDTRVVQAHYELATRYLDRVHCDEIAKSAAGSSLD